MPPITRAQLVNQKDLSVDELATLADTIMLSQASLHNLIEMGNGLPVSRFLKSGYNQVTMDPGAVAKTTVITPFGLRERNQMPFGLKNSRCTFQRVIHEVLCDIPYIFCHKDDILVSSPTIEAHEQHLREVFTHL